MRTGVKICGIKTEETLAAAVRGGAAFIGLVFHPTSPRHVTLGEAAVLRARVPEAVRVVAVTVDANDALLGEIAERVGPDLFQLHGSESAARTAAVRRLTDRPVIKAIGLARAEGLVVASAFEPVADYLLFDAKSAAGAVAGGSGKSFDWRILSGRTFARPWFLSGGLGSANVKEALGASGARLIDVSSGVERARGEKDPQLVAAFLDTVRGL